MIIEPNSNIRIIKTPIELDSLNQLTFSTKAAQEEYFKSLPYIEIDDASYQRKDGYIRFPQKFDEAIKYNYCMYQNEGYSNKWFYAFIKDVQYLNDEVTAIYLETDVYQTWCFDVLWRESFIEREMLATADDIMGANTQPENLELGEYIYSKNKEDYYYSKILYGICVGVTNAPTGVTDVSSGTDVDINITKDYNGIPSGVSYVSPTDINKFLEIYAKSGQSDSIQCIFIYPYDAYEHETHYWFKSGVTQSGGTEVDYIKSSTDYTSLSDFDITPPTTVGNNYTPKNKKLFTFPYSYFNFTNNVGITESFRYEDFTKVDNKIKFKVACALSPGMNIKAIPYKYKYENSTTDDYNYLYNDGITGPKLPIGSWNTDVYINWLTQNSLNVPLSILGSTVQTVGGLTLAATGAGAMAGASQITSGILGIANTLSKIYEAHLTPHQASGNINTSDVNYAFGSGMFSVYHLSIKNEYCKIIDDFFSMFGYKTNLVKLPNLNNRSKWNYVKTINANIVGDVPQKDLQKYKDLFNNGITLWHDPLYFLDYSQTNS